MAQHIKNIANCPSHSRLMGLLSNNQTHHPLRTKRDPTKRDSHPRLLQHHLLYPLQVEILSIN